MSIVRHVFVRFLYYIGYQGLTFFIRVIHIKTSRYRSK